MHVTQDLESTEAVEAVRAVVREALDRATDDPEATWAAFGEAGLLSLPVPAEHGGEGLGLTEVAVLLRETGHRALQLPVWETLCCGVRCCRASRRARRC
jgi:3-oxo-4-pregnene-20-carboxyl-CoA dehydrogenase beta subunit